MRLTAEEVNALKDKCSYGGDYWGLYQRLEYDKPANLRLSIIEKDLLACWLEDACTDAELSIKKKLLKENGDYR